MMKNTRSCANSQVLLGWTNSKTSLISRALSCFAQLSLDAALGDSSSQYGRVF